MDKRYLLFAVAGLVMTVLSTATVSIHADVNPDKSDTVRGVSVVPQKSMSESASKILRHIVDARAQIHRGELKRAESELHAASTLIDYIESVVPSTQIADHIWVAEKHLDYQEPHEVALDLIPVEISLTDIEEVYLIRQAKRHIENTKSHLNNRDVEAARKELIQLRESLTQTEVDLPLTSTKQHINEAFALLVNADPKGADSALKNAESGVRFVSLGASTPLAKSRRLLWQAVEDYAVGRHDAVKEKLSNALNLLEQVKSGADSKTHDEAQRLGAEIRELLDNERHKLPERSSELTGFWHKVVALIEREAENLYNAWRSQQSENHLFRQLIDARFHLFYAEYDLFETGKVEDAKWELTQSKNYLKAAMSETSGIRKKRIRAIKQQVENLESQLENPDADVRQRYDETLMKLRLMIKEK